jgi:hypothetical protein
MEEKQVSVEGETRALPSPVLRDRHAEPARPAGHLRLARVAARPLPDAHHARLPRPRQPSACCWRASDRRDMGRLLPLLRRRAGNNCSRPVLAGARCRPAAGLRAGPDRRHPHPAAGSCRACRRAPASRWCAPPRRRR